MTGKRLALGQVQVYTGKGKGKTTAAFGLAFRAAGQGYPVFIGQFLKSGDSGEYQAAQWTHGLVCVRQFGGGGFVGGREGATPEECRLAQAGFAEIRQAMRSGDYALVIADEINVAVEYGLLSVQDILDLLEQRPPWVELVLTGRYAAEAVIAAADLVTEMQPRKHYYHAGVAAREGVER